MSMKTVYDTTQEYNIETHIHNGDKDLNIWDYTLYRKMTVDVLNVEKHGNKLIITTPDGDICTWKHKKHIIDNLKNCDQAILYVTKRIKDNTLWTALTNWE